MCLTGLPGQAEVVRSSEDATEGEEEPQAKPWLPLRAGYNQHHQLLLCCQVQPSRALPGHRPHLQRCICQPWYRLPWALLTSFLESRHDLDRTSSVLPLAWGVWLQSWSPLGLSSVLGAAVRNTSPTGRVMGDGRLCVTHLLD